MNDTKLEYLCVHIVAMILNKTRDYYGRNDRVSNEFVRELEEDVKIIITKHLDQ